MVAVKSVALTHPPEPSPPRLKRMAGTPMRPVALCSSPRSGVPEQGASVKGRGPRTSLLWSSQTVHTMDLTYRCSRAVGHPEGDKIGIAGKAIETLPFACNSNLLMNTMM